MSTGIKTTVISDGIHITDFDPICDIHLVNLLTMEVTYPKRMYFYHPYVSVSAPVNT